MGMVYSGATLYLNDGRILGNCTIVVENAHIVVNSEPEDEAGPDRMDYIFGWSHVREIKLK